MLIIPLTTGPLLTNCYIVACEKTFEALVIDPGFSEYESNYVFSEINKHGLQVKYILNTHGHVDHISGNALMKEETKAKILIHQADAEMLSNPLKNFSLMLGSPLVSPPPDLTLKDGDVLRIGSLEFRVLHTPGHTLGSISLYCRNEKVVFTGDTLFAGSIGRTDLPGASYKALISSIKMKLLNLPDETIVYPGHGGETTIGMERKLNPFLR